MVLNENIVYFVLKFTLKNQSASDVHLGFDAIYITLYV